MASAHDIQTIRTIADGMQIIGVSGVIFDIYGTRIVLGMRRPTRVVRDWLAHVAASVAEWARRIAMAVVRRFRARRPQSYDRLIAEGSVKA